MRKNLKLRSGYMNWAKYSADRLEIPTDRTADQQLKNTGQVSTVVEISRSYNPHGPQINDYHHKKYPGQMDV